MEEVWLLLIRWYDTKEPETCNPLFSTILGYKHTEEEAKEFISEWEKNEFEYTNLDPVIERKDGIRLFHHIDHLSDEDDEDDFIEYFRGISAQKIKHLTKEEETEEWNKNE